MPMHETHDVVVVGGRPAGAATAMLLSRAGLRVLLLEKGRAGSDTLSTHALMRPAVQLLHEWGLLPAIAAGAPLLTRTTFHYGVGDPVTVPVAARGGIDGLHAPRRTLLDPLLAAAAADAGADVRFGVTASELLVEDGRVAGVRARSGGRELAARATLTIGADGRGSRIARAVGAPATWTGTHAAGYAYRYWPGLPADGYDWFYRPGSVATPGVSAGLIPTGDGLANVFVGASDAVFAAMVAESGPEQAYQRLLRIAAPELAERLDGVTPASAVRAFGGRAGHLRVPHGPGWALVGDAGYFKDPSTAHGITDALRDARLLADAVLAQGPGGSLAAYEAERDRLSLPFARLTDEIAGFRWDLPRLGELLLAASDAMREEGRALQASPVAA